MPNILNDIIIVGASPEGIALCDYLCAKRPDLKIILISTHFNNICLRHKLNNVERITDTVIYSNYMHGVITLTLASGKLVHATNVVLATGTKPTKLDLCTKNIYYKASDVDVCSKVKQAVVIGNNSKAITAALWASRRFRYVYLCAPAIKIDATKKDVLRLSQVNNIVYLPNCSIRAVQNDKRGDLEKVILDTYEELNCHAILAITKRTPDVPKFNMNMIELEDGYIKVNHVGETTVVPKIYAIGACTKHTSKRNITIVGKNILSKLED